MLRMESLAVVSRVLGVVCEVMTPDQCREAADRLRRLDGDDAERKLFAGLADGLDTFAADTDDPGAPERLTNL